MHWHRWFAACPAALLLCSVGAMAQPASAQTQADAASTVWKPASAVAQLSGSWADQGPGPATDGQVENVTPNDEVVGAVEAVVAHPADADTLWIGGVNAGIWKTTNATASSPNWVHLTDDKSSLSIGGLDLDPTDASHQTLLAGIGRFSSLGRIGGERIGLLRTTDGGSSWTLFDGGGTLTGKNIAAVAARGSTLLAAVNVADSFTYSNIGIFRSTDGGSSFTQISSGDGTATGLPGGVTHDLAGDPSNTARFYTSVTFAGGVGGSNGVYRSDDTGATWSKVSDAAMDALIVDGLANIEISVGSSSNVYVGIVGSDGELDGVFRSGNGGSSWTAMDLPETTEGGGAIFGVHPGGQGAIHFSILADPGNADIVYIGGDRQPFFSEGGGAGFWPNSIGANDFSGRLFRGDASQPGGSQWTPLTHSGTASNSSPHADSREMTFDAAGNLIEVDDGGIYKRTSPQLGSGDWFSINGDLQSTEYHGIAYDQVSGIVFGGAQDTGSTEQVAPGSKTFRSISTADGGDVAVDDHSSASQSTRYTSFQFLSAFRRRIVNASNVVTGTAFPTLTPIGGSPALDAQFYTPIMVNTVSGDRLLIGADNGLYESLDRGDTITRIGAGIKVNAFVGDPIIYGVPGNADLIYVADDGSLYRRTAAPGAGLTLVTSPTSLVINDLAIEGASPDNLFAVDTGGVYRSTNAASSWSTVTGNLSSLDPGRLRALQFVPGADAALVVGADRGIYVAYQSDGFAIWSKLGGTGLPNAPVFELDYSAQDGVLVAGLLGRGAWILEQAGDVIFADRFD